MRLLLSILTTLILIVATSCGGHDEPERPRPPSPEQPTNPDNPDNPDNPTDDPDYSSILADSTPRIQSSWLTATYGAPGVLIMSNGNKEYTIRDLSTGQYAILLCDRGLDQLTAGMQTEVALIVNDQRFELSDCRLLEFDPQTPIRHLVMHRVGSPGDIVVVVEL